MSNQTHNFTLPYKHSTPASLDTHTQKRYLSRFEPRISNYISTPQNACIECQIDLFGREAIGKVVGGMNAHVGDFTALCAPEALPDRIGLCSYFIEYAFVHDDVSVDAIQTARVHEDVQRNEPTIAIESSLRRKQARAKIWSVLNDLDAEYFARCQKTFTQWFETGRQMRDQAFINLEDYLATRAVDCGANWVVRMMGWASGVELSSEEEVETGPVTYLAFVVLGVTNDIWSWEKEKRVTRESGGSSPLINAVQFVMQMHDVDEDTAKQTVCRIIREHEEQYCRLRDEYLQSPNLSLAVRKWFQVLELSIAGNALWSIHAIRYHPDVRNPYSGPFDFSSDFNVLAVVQPRLGSFEERSALNECPEHKHIDGPDETEKESTLAHVLRVWGAYRDTAWALQLN
ncbi:isoprenoid synthase domain-containing protein [Aspergillus aurantiobrunneus]